MRVPTMEEKRENPATVNDCICLLKVIAKKKRNEEILAVLIPHAARCK